jgi:hypothetical protein
MPIVFVALAIYSNRQETLYQRDQVRHRLRNDIELAEMRRYWFPWRDALDEDEVSDPILLPGEPEQSHQYRRARGFDAAPGESAAGPSNFPAERVR